MYTHIQNSADLKAAIVEMEEKQRREKLELVENFHVLTESLKPMNLIKSSIHKVTSTPGIGGTILKASMGLGAGLISKKLLVGHSTGILKMLAGNAVKLGVAGIIAKKSDNIKYAGLKLLTNMFGKKK